MKKTPILLGTLLVILSGCYILSSDDTITPEIKIEPPVVMAGQDIIITINSPDEFIMPFCGGITYEIEKNVSEGWEVSFGQYGPCNHLMLPETHLSKSHTVLLTIDEPGVYRFRSRFKFEREDTFEVLYSEEFKVKSRE